MSDVLAISLAGLRPIKSAFSRGFAAGDQGESTAGPTFADEGEDPYAKGYADGQASARAEMTKRCEAQDRLASAISGVGQETSEDLGLIIAQTVFRLVTHIIGETDIDAEALHRRAQAAAALLCENDAATAILLHPDDAALLPETVAGLSVGTRSDLERGDVVIDHGSGTIEDKMAHHMDALEAALGLGRDR